MITVGTECSGIETPLIALAAAGVKYRHEFSCERDTHARKVIEKLFPPTGEIYSDIFTRDVSKMPQVDLYVCGFPCQSFSALGKQKGFEGSTVFFKAAEYIRERHPKAFVLENVYNLLGHDKGNTFKVVMETLKNIPGYDVSFGVFNSKNYGVPQSRRRVYIVGVSGSGHTADAALDYAKGKACDATPKLTEYLMPEDSYHGGRDDVARNAPLRGISAANLERLKAEGIDMTQCRCYDLGASWRFMCKKTLEISPCLSATRSDYYLTDRKRKLDPTDCLMLQGVPLEVANKIVKVPGVTRRQVYKQAGNAMTVTVVGAVLEGVIRACGLGSEKERGAMDTLEASAA